MTHQISDRLSVRGLAIHAHHGVFDFERRDGQEFVIDLVMDVDTRAAARTDDLQETVDYGTLVEEVRSAVANDPVDLIETLAQRIADVCLRHAPVAAVEVTVHKPHAPIPTTFQDVALTITRSRQ